MPPVRILKPVSYTHLDVYKRQKEIRHYYPEANIIAVDYDPGASEVNQLNRIKLMLSQANMNLKAAEETEGI